MLENNRYLILTAIFLVFTIVLFEYTSLDIYVQNYFFQMNTHTWILNRDEPILKFLLYDGIKKLLIFFALSILLTLIFFRKKDLIKRYRNGLLIIVLSSIFVPLVVGSLKAVTNTPCPKNLEYYGGRYPDVKVFGSYPKDFVQKRKIKCWPAGHASGGFALMALFFLFKKRKNKIIALVFGLFVGWSMGLYKMLIGDHFSSHTIITMLLAWLIILIIAKIVQRKELEKPAQI
jgi:membrane-associated PAP2 superfamily phosphatase